MNEPWTGGNPRRDWEDMMQRIRLAGDGLPDEYFAAQRRLNDAAERAFLKSSLPAKLAIGYGSCIGHTVPIGTGAMSSPTINNGTTSQASIDDMKAAMAKFEEQIAACRATLFDRLVLTKKQSDWLYEKMSNDCGVPLPSPSEPFPPATGIYGVPVEVFPDSTGVTRRLIQHAESTSKERIGYIVDDQFRIVESGGNPYLFPLTPTELKMSDAKNPVATDSTVAEAHADTVETLSQPATTDAAPPDPSTVETPQDTTPAEVGTEETAGAQAQGETPVQPESTTESSVTPEAAPEEAGDQSPLDYLLELEQAARDVPRDHPDDSGWLLRVRASLVRIRMAPTADTGCKAADLFITDGRVLMIMSLVKRLARENPETPMETAIGNVAIADELERFDAIGLPPKDLALLCERLVPLACGL